MQKKLKKKSSNFIAQDKPMALHQNFVESVEEFLSSSSEDGPPCTTDNKWGLFMLVPNQVQQNLLLLQK